MEINKLSAAVGIYKKTESSFKLDSVFYPAATSASWLNF